MPFSIGYRDFRLEMALLTLLSPQTDNQNLSCYFFSSLLVLFPEIVIILPLLLYQKNLFCSVVSLHFLLKSYAIK